MKHTTKKHKDWQGTGGWVEGYKEVQVPITVVTSKSTGKNITLYGHLDKVSAQDIRSAIASRYDKDTKRHFLGMKNKDLENDFE